MLQNLSRCLLSFLNFPKNTQLFIYFPVSFFFPSRISSDCPKNKPGSELSCFEPLPASPAGSMHTRDVPVSARPFGTFCGLSAPAGGILCYWGSPPISHPSICDLKCFNYFCKMLREQKEKSRTMPSCFVLNSLLLSLCADFIEKLFRKHRKSLLMSPALKFRLYFFSPTQILLTRLAHPKQYWKWSQQKPQD